MPGGPTKRRPCPPGGRHLESAFGFALSADFGQARERRRGLDGARPGQNRMGPLLSIRLGAEQQRHHIGQMRGPPDANPRGPTRSFGRAAWDEDFSGASGSDREHASQCPARGAQATIEGEFAEKAAVDEGIGRDGPGGGEDADGDREIEARAVLAKLGGGEVDRDPPVGKVEAGGCNGPPDSGHAFSDSGLRQSDDIDSGQLGRDSDFDFDKGAADADQGRGKNTRHGEFSQRDRGTRGAFGASPLRSQTEGSEEPGEVRTGERGWSEEGAQAHGPVGFACSIVPLWSLANSEKIGGRQSPQGRALPPTFEKPREERAYHEKSVIR